MLKDGRAVRSRIIPQIFHCRLEFAVFALWEWKFSALLTSGRVSTHESSTFHVGLVLGGTKK